MLWKNSFQKGKSDKKHFTLTHLLHSTDVTGNHSYCCHISVQSIFGSYFHKKGEANEKKAKPTTSLEPKFLLWKKLRQWAGFGQESKTREMWQKLSEAALDCCKTTRYLPNNQLRNIKINWLWAVNKEAAYICWPPYACVRHHNSTNFACYSSTMAAGLQEEKCPFLDTFVWQKSYLNDDTYKHLVAIISVLSIAGPTNYYSERSSRFFRGNKTPTANPFIQCTGGVSCRPGFIYRIGCATFHHSFRHWTNLRWWAILHLGKDIDNSFWWSLFFIVISHPCSLHRSIHGHQVSHEVPRQCDKSATKNWCSFGLGPYIAFLYSSTCLSFNGKWL